MPKSNAQRKKLITENIMLPMDVQALPEADTALIYTTSMAEDGHNTGRVYLSNNVKTLQLTARRGDYSPPTSTVDGDTLWITHTAYETKYRSLWLHAVKDGSKVVSLNLMAPAKIDNPHISVMGNHVHLVWEDYTRGESCLKYAVYAQASLLAGETTPVTDPVFITEPKSYKPQLIANGDQLYLFYEWYYQGRYRLMARCLTDIAAGFSPACEVGLDAHNDQAVSLTIHEGKVVAVWENSRPLHKGYEWVSPKGNGVIIPNFGHGWRVNTEMALRRISFQDGTWQSEDIVTAPGESIDPQESAGAPRVRVVDNTLYVSYLRWDYGSSTTCKGWQIITKLFNGQRWIELDATGLFQKQRVAPAVLIDGANGVISAVGQSPELEKQAWPAWIQENAATFLVNQALPNLPSVQSAVYTISHRNQLAQPVPSLHRTRHSVAFSDGERQLLWGDLHMHSNTSPCSLGARFHCTEMEEKFRFSRDVGQLDFALNTDHDSMGDNEWIRNGNSAHFHDLPGSFIAFNGYEWTCTHFDDKPNYGHYNILYKDDGPMLRTLNEDYNSIPKAIAALSPDDALAIPHHPGDNTHPVDWNAFDSSFVPLVEIFQVRGSYEADNCAMHPQLWGRGIVRKHSLQYGLNRGFDFGFTAGGEHEGVGVTGVYATEFTREGIFNALRERRTFGTTGDRIVVDFRVEHTPMGGRLETSAAVLHGYLSVLGTDVITDVKLVRNGAVIQAWQPDALTVILDWDIERTADEREYYYAVITQCNGEMAWSSPVFVYRQ